MARNSKPSQPAEDALEEMTVVIFKLKGHSGTLQKGFDAINTAFTAFGTQLTSQPNGRRLISGTSNISAVIPDGSVEASDEDAENEEVVTQEPPTRTQSKPRQIRKPKFLEAFDLNQSGNTWKAFASEKPPKTDADKYLVAALWITENANVPEFGISHVFTCFRAMGWSEQVDFSQPLRLMKSKKSYFTNPSPKVWKLTGPGLDAARAARAK